MQRHIKHTLPLRTHMLRLIAEGLEYNHVLLEINLHGNRGHTETDVLGFMYEPPRTYLGCLVGWLVREVFGGTVSSVLTVRAQT